MEKPIVLGVEGERAELVMSAGGGICIEPETAKDLAIQVLKLYRDPAMCQELGSSGRRYVLEHFDRQVLARHLADVIQRAVGKWVKWKLPGCRGETWVLFNGIMSLVLRKHAFGFCK